MVSLEAFSELLSNSTSIATVAVPLTRFVTIHERDGRTDTARRQRPCLCRASREKKLYRLFDGYSPGPALKQCCV